MPEEVTIEVHRIAVDGLPDLATPVAVRIAFIFDGHVLSGRPLRPDEHPKAYAQVRAAAGSAKAPRQVATC